METMNMLMMLVVAAILFCSHHHSLRSCAMKEILQPSPLVEVMCDEGNELGIWPWDISCYLPWPYPFPRPYACPPPRLRPPLPPHSPRPSPPPPALATSCSTSDKEKMKMCIFNTTSIDECCPTFKSILGTSCPCYKYAVDLDNQVLITLEAYCDINSPCRGVPSPPPPPPQPSCSASDQEKVKTCMFNTNSIDECCPTFKSILGTSCPCYKYAEDLDNQVLITLKAYCNVTSPCKGVQVIKLSKDDE